MEGRTSWTQADFKAMSWHDNYVHGVTFDVDVDTWRSDLVLDIDHIVEWLCEGATCRFQVAPATLRFHDVTDLRFDVDWGDSGHRTALHLVSIDGISRRLVADQKICLDRPYWAWRIEINWPRGTITFGASGFTQTLSKPPVLCDEQALSAAQRRPD